MSELDGFGLQIHVHVHDHETPRLRPGVLPGPAELDPASPEADLRKLFGDDYGNGDAISLSKDDPEFQRKKAALEAAERRWDRTMACWVRRT